VRISNDDIINGPVDLSANWTSDPIWLGHLYAYSVQLKFSGAPNGVFRLQCSNDKETDVSTAAGVVNWTLYAGSSQVITEAGDHTWSVSDAGYRWVRVQWLAGLGTGSLDSAKFNAKGV
jgi:hypothetical protein